MANLIIKSDERRVYENKVLRDFGVNPDRAAADKRELGEHIAARSAEALHQLRRMEENRR